MIDFHCHLLPALDDGALSVDESLAMAKTLADFGYTAVCCTPHCIKGYYDLTPQKVREATLMLQADLDNAGIRLELLPGMEYMLDECFADGADELLPLGATRLVLCEAPPQAHPAVVRENLALIVAKGFVPLIAHPERSEHFYAMFSPPGAAAGSTKKPAARSLKDAETKAPFWLKRFFLPRAARPAPQRAATAGSAALPEACLFHANLGSFTGYYGEAVQRRAYELLKQGVYTALASDLHNAAAAPAVLVRDKFATNPLLKKLAEFDGAVAAPAASGGGRGKGQGELF